VVVFSALKNAQSVYVDFWFWKVNSNLSLVIVLSVTFGALSSFLLSLPYRARKNREIKERDERIEFLDNEILHLDPKAEKPHSNENEAVQ
jgi:uncharacterized integral membrane protein